jgi:hypothetical protein
MLLNGAGADIELACDVFVTASLDEQIQDLLVARRDFDLIQIDHGWFLPACVLFTPESRTHWKQEHELRQLFAPRDGRANPYGSLHFGPYTRVFMWLSESVW